MKKFKFKLKALLSYREHIEKMAKEEVARVQIELQRCVKRIQEHKETSKRTVAEFDEKMAKGISAEEHQIYTDYLISLEIKVEEENELLEKLKKVLIVKQEELTKKSISKKVIETLKEKKKEEYYMEMNRNELKDADEMVIISGLNKKK